MKHYLLTLIAACMLLSSCDIFSSHGKKVEIGKSEVFYKGDGVTEEQAKSVGEFLKEKEWFSDETPASAQLTKEDDIYMVRLVLADTENIAESLRLSMWKLQYQLSQDVFDGTDARFVFSDDKFKELDALEPIARIAVGKGSVFYDNGEYRKKEVQKLADFFQDKGYIGKDKAVDIFLTREEESPIIRLVVDRAMVEENEAEILPIFSYWQALIQEDVLADKKARMVLANIKMKDFKKVPKLTDEMRAKIETPTTTEAEYTNNSIDSVSSQTTVSGIERLQND